MVALEAFAELLALEEARIDLVRACLMIAEDVYPELDAERYVAHIEQLAQRLRARVAQSGSPEERIIALNQFLFAELGYAGNADAYYDPRNSYLNEVLERRTGIPITLSIVYMELGRRIGLPLEGVSFPGHFLVRLRLRQGTLVLDAFSGGAPLSGLELRERLKRVAPPGATGSLSVAELPLEQFLEAAGKKQILSRLLRNLKGIYLALEEPQRALEVLNRILVVAPHASVELRDRGLLYERLECWRPALQDLSAYCERAPKAPDAEAVRARIIELTARCAKLN